MEYYYILKKLHGALVEEPHLEILPIWSLWKYHFGPCGVFALADVMPPWSGVEVEKKEKRGGNKVG